MLQLVKLNNGHYMYVEKVIDLKEDEALCVNRGKIQIWSKQEIKAVNNDCSILSVFSNGKETERIFVNLEAKVINGPGKIVMPNNYLMTFYQTPEKDLELIDKLPEEDYKAFQKIEADRLERNPEREAYCG